MSVSVSLIAETKLVLSPVFNKDKSPILEALDLEFPSNSLMADTIVDLEVVVKLDKEPLFASNSLIAATVLVFAVVVRLVAKSPI
jgi:hypothetical protein